jgi:RING finger family protein
MVLGLPGDLLSWRPHRWRSSPEAPALQNEGDHDHPTGVTDEDCPICHEEVGTPQEHRDGYAESWLYLPCGHRFGSLCLYHWIIDGAFDGRCPLCRRNVQSSCGHFFVPRARRLTPHETAWFATSTPHDRPVADMCAFCIHRARDLVPRDDPRKATKSQAGLYFLEQANSRRPPLTPGEWMADARRDKLWRMWFEMKLGSVVWPAKTPGASDGEPAETPQDEDPLGEGELLPPKRHRRRLQRARR